MFYCFCYRSPTEFWEGNVFTRVCLFTGSPHVTITRDALYLAVQALPLALLPPPPPSDMGPPATDIWCPPLETCLNLFIWHLTAPTPPPLGLTSVDQSMHGWQMGGMHPTECWLLKVLKLQQQLYKSILFYKKKQKTKITIPTIFPLFHRYIKISLLQLLLHQLKLNESHDFLLLSLARLLYKFYTMNIVTKKWFFARRISRSCLKLISKFSVIYPIYMISRFPPRFDTVTDLHD